MIFSEIEGDKRYEFRKAIFKSGSSKSAGITRNSIREDIQMNIYCMAVQEIYGTLPTRASLYYLKDDKAIDLSRKSLFPFGFSPIVLTQQIPE